jgi:protein-tyrosine phosphatase
VRVVRPWRRTPADDHLEAFLATIFLVLDEAIETHIAQAANEPSDLSLRHLYPIDGGAPRRKGRHRLGRTRCEQLAFFFKLVNDPAAQPVYVHCKGGRHRTGVMTAAYRMSFDGWTADQAFGEMKRYDFGPDFLHPEFKKYVYGYDPKGITVTTAVAVTTQQQ